MANYNKHFVQPQNYCYKVLSTSSNARNSLYRQRPKQAAHEDVSAWHRHLPTDASSEPKAQPWFKKGNRRYASDRRTGDMDQERWTLRDMQPGE